MNNSCHKCGRPLVSQHEKGAGTCHVCSSIGEEKKERKDKIEKEFWKEVKLL